MSEHTLPQLPYAYNALEPAISEEIMTIHHTKHHQLYVTNLNNAIKAYNSAISSNDVRKQIELQSAIKFNGGGHINHSLFWKNLAPANQGGGSLHDGPLKQAIERDFGSLDNLKASFNATIATIQGSGWGWLGFNPKNSKLEVITKYRPSEKVLTLGRAGARDPVLPYLPEQPSTARVSRCSVHEIAPRRTGTVRVPLNVVTMVRDTDRVSEPAPTAVTR